MSIHRRRRLILQLMLAVSTAIVTNTSAVGAVIHWSTDVKYYNPILSMSCSGPKGWVGIIQSWDPDGRPLYGVLPMKAQAVWLKFSGANERPTIFNPQFMIEVLRRDKRDSSVSALSEYTAQVDDKEFIEKPHSFASNSNGWSKTVYTINTTARGSDCTLVRTVYAKILKNSLILIEATVDQSEYKDNATTIDTAVRDVSFNSNSVVQKASSPKSGSESTGVSASEIEAQRIHDTGRDLIQAGQYMQAFETLTQADKMSPNDPSIQCDLGLVLLKTGKAEAAIEVLLEATASNKYPPPESWENLGSAYEVTGKLKEATSAYQKYLSLVPINSTGAKVIQTHLQLIRQALLAQSASSKDNYLSEATADFHARWNKTPITVYIQPGDSVRGYQPEFATVIQRAFEQWSTASRGKLAFEFLKTKGPADITVSWTNDLSRILSPAEGGHALYGYQFGTNNLTTAAITLLTVHVIDASPQTASELSWVALHEIGHVLGLAGHSPQTGDIMYFCSPGLINCAAAKLSDRDAHTIRRLYGQTN